MCVFISVVYRLQTNGMTCEFLTPLLILVRLRHALTDLTNHSEVSTLRAIKKLCLLLQRSVKQLSFRTEWQLTFPYFSLEAKLKSKSTLDEARWRWDADANIFCMCDWGGYKQLLGLNQRNKTKGNITLQNLDKTLPFAIIMTGRVHVTEPSV